MRGNRVVGKTSIEWCTHSLNFVKWWCTKISPGCANCYMMALRDRYPQHGADGPVWRDKADRELRALPTGAEVFVGDMYDLFHKDMPDDWIAEQILNAPVTRRDCTFLYLTKRIERAADFLQRWALPLNVWIGTSVENQKYTWRIDDLRHIDAHRFISFEPLLGPIEADLTGIDGVITGAESGAKRRPFDPQWAEDIRLQCEAQGVMFFHKQGSSQWPGKHRELFGVVYDDLPWRQEVAQRTLL